MSKEIYISTTPHETRLAIVEDEQLAEIYYERENEYTLAGSIYNGKVTRVLPGMQSSFVDIGLERDAFLYVTDFMEEQGDSADFDGESSGRRPSTNDQEEGARNEVSRGSRDRGSRRGRRDVTDPAQETPSFDEPIAPAPVPDVAPAVYDNQAALEEQGSRRWRGRRGRRRGRSGREGASDAEVVSGTYAEQVEPELLGNGETIVIEGSSDTDGFTESGLTPEGAIEIDLTAAADSGEAENLGRRNVHRPGREGRPGSEERVARQMRPVRSDESERTGRTDRGREGRRGAEPRESFRGTRQDESLDGVPEENTPLLLPGESIRKYRDPAEIAADDAKRPTGQAAASVPIAASRPSYEIVGWDGSATLPGETLSRYRKPSAQTRMQTPVELQAVADETSAAEVPLQEPETASQVNEQAVEETNTSASQAAIEAISHPGVLESTENLAEGSGTERAHAANRATHDPHGIVVAAEESVAVPSAGEYEPEEGESVSLGESGRRDYRRQEPRSEPDDSAEETSSYPADEAQDDASPTSVSSGTEASAEEAESNPAELDNAMGSELNTPFTDGEHAATKHEFSTIQPDGAMLTETEQGEGRETPDDEFVTAFERERHDETEDHVREFSSEAPVPQIHAYGEGDLQEEEMEGDEFEYDFAAESSDEDDLEDYEEETLEGTADLGTMLQEISLEQRTLPVESEEVDEDTEDDDATGGFTEEDFGGEPEEEVKDAGNSAPAPGERRGRRDPRRFGRDRGGRGERSFRGGAGADRGRGRGRQSVQTMDLPAITDLLKPGQEVLVQIAKEPIAKKGARITSHIALPGRFLVFMPTVNHTGVSRKISSDDERRRLKSVLLSEKGEVQGGFIVRTAAEGVGEDELRNDLRFLIQLWQDIKSRSETSKSPALIYHDLGLIERILRDQVTDTFSAIWVDSEQEYERVLRFLQRFQPSLVRRVKLYSKETPLFEHFGITPEIDRALKSKVWLKSGGSIVINQTEALVAIDINTGKYVGKTARLEDTILKTNLDAIPEIVRQIRLRDLGGIIVIDFIDMDERKNRARVMQALEDELKTDRAPSKVLPFNDFGLVIMTRKRVKQSLERTLCIPDPVTEGTGMIKSPVTVSNEIYVEMRKMYRHIDKADVMLRVHPEVVKQLKSNGARRLQELEEMTHKTLLLKSDPALSPEQFDIH